MNIDIEKKLIIEEINNVKDEWILKAIKKLLDIESEEELSQEYQQILDERIASFEADPLSGIEWEVLKKELLRK